MVKLNLQVNDDFGEEHSYLKDLPDGDWELVCPYRDLVKTKEELIKTEDNGRRIYHVFDMWSIGIVYRNKQTGERVKVEKRRERTFGQEITR